MISIIRIALKDLLKRWGLALVTAILFSIIFASFLALIAYKNSLVDAYSNLSQIWLIVQKSDGVGEIHGSRLTPEIGDLLIKKGYNHPIPEIHQIVGTSLATGMMMRGISLEDYTSVSHFSMESGEALISGDISRLAMVGVTLAELNKIHTGDKIKVRGRDFYVKGIFRTGTYQDNEVWISLADAQALLNYGQDVSIYIIPEGGELQEGENLGDGISISRKGEAGQMLGNEIASFYNYMGMVALFAGVASVLTLTNLLWRLAWLHRREFGILRTLGFRRWALMFYLLVQSMIILFIGLLAGATLAITVIAGQAQQITAFGLGLSPNWNLQTFVYASGITLIILSAGIAFPVMRISRISIPDLLGRE